MPERKFSVGSEYRYGFNGKELDTESSVQYDYGFRIYDPRLGRFKSVDPLQKKFAELTPYQFTSNSPISYTDLDGREAIYYMTTIDYVTKYHQCGDGSYEASTTSSQNTEVVKTGVTPNGTLGSGQLYIIQSRVSEIFYDINGNPESQCYEKPITLQKIYILSKSDLMKKDINERPEFKGKYQIMVFGSASDNSESPGEKPNPNAITETIDMQVWDEIFAPILTGMNYKNPIKSQSEPPEFNDLLETRFDRAKEKYEKEKYEKENQPDPKISYCESCHGNYKIGEDGQLTWDSASRAKTPLDTVPYHGADTSKYPSRKTKVKNE